MTVSAERLAEVDAELEALGRSSGEIETVLARFEGHEPGDLDAVDAQLADLASGVDFVMPEPAKRAEPAPKRERSRKRAASRAPVPAAPVHDDVDPDDMPTVESADSAGSRLSAEDLFGDTPSDEPPGPPADEAGPKDYSYLFGPDSDVPPPAEEGAEGDALLESLEAELDGFRAPPGGDETEADPTHVFSSSDLESIERDAMESAPPSPAEGRRPSDVPSARPPRPPSQRPPSRDPEFDALLGDPDAVFRPSQYPPAEQAHSVDDDVDMGTGDFEVLVDDDILVEVDEDPLDALPSVVPPAASQAPPVPPMPRPPSMPVTSASPSQRPSQRPPEGDDEEGGQKKGFFKKLFGGKE